jgi:hypothetical protein
MVKSNPSPTAPQARPKPSRNGKAPHGPEVREEAIPIKLVALFRVAANHAASFYRKLYGEPKNANLYFDLIGGDVNIVGTDPHLHLPVLTQDGKAALSNESLESGAVKVIQSARKFARTIAKGLGGMQKGGHDSLILWLDEWRDGWGCAMSVYSSGTRWLDLRLVPDRESAAK